MIPDDRRGRPIKQISIQKAIGVFQLLRHRHCGLKQPFWSAQTTSPARKTMGLVLDMPGLNLGTQLWHWVTPFAKLFPNVLSCSEMRSAIIYFNQVPANIP